MLNFMLHEFYHNKKKLQNKTHIFKYSNKKKVSSKIQPITKKHQSLLFGLHILKIHKHPTFTI